jgi:diguanylate cyclase (GGDEF)-like protein
MPPPVRDDNATRNCRYKRSLTLRYIVALSLVAALALLSYGVFRYFMVTIDRAASITAISGSQRILTQRVLAQCLLLSAADDEEAHRDIRAHLTHAITLLEENHKRLLGDLEDPDSFAAHSPELAAIYFKPPYELDRRMRFFIDNTRAFTRSESGRPALSDPNFQNILAFGENELLRDLNAVVQAYQRQALQRLTTLRRLEAAATAALLLLLVAVGLCILRPMVRRICNDRGRLEAANASLTQLAVTDQLTSAYNRLKFNEVMDHEIKRTSRYGGPLSVIMFDIDHFKKVNDTYGHAAGDDMLRELSRRIRASIRNVDWLFRYGGEEFVVTTPQTTLESAAALAEKLRAFVAATPFPHDIAGSISLGVAELRPGETVEELMGRVDAAMYQAKNTGRNRVVVAE